MATWIATTNEATSFIILSAAAAYLQLYNDVFRATLGFWPKGNKWDILDPLCGVMGEISTSRMSQASPFGHLANSCGV